MEVPIKSRPGTARHTLAIVFTAVFGVVDLNGSPASLTICAAGAAEKEHSVWDVAVELEPLVADVDELALVCQNPCEHDWCTNHRTDTLGTYQLTGPTQQ